MSAPELREAAKMLRYSASRATPGAWKLWGMCVLADQDGTSNLDSAVDVALTRFRDKNGKPRTFDASYISLTQPVVGLALADWLDVQAEHVASHDCEANCAYPDGGPQCRAALTIARLINGDAS